MQPLDFPAQASVPRRTKGFAVTDPGFPTEQFLGLPIA